MATTIATVRDTGGQKYKVDIIADAYSQLRISGLTVNPTPEDLDVALMRLENMMSQWETTKNLVMGYNFEEIPDPNSLTNVKNGYSNSMAANLAIRLIPDFNKEVPAILYSLASGAFSAMSGAIQLERLNQVSPPRRQPIGGGNSLRWNRWARFYRDYSGAPNVNKSVTMFVSDINDFKEQFDSYLNEFEEISSFDIQVDSGLELVSSSLSDTNRDIDYRIKAVSTANEFNNFVSQVTIIATTDSGRVETRRIFFTVEAARTPEGI